MSLPIDRTAKAVLDANLVNGILSDGPKIKASEDVVYNTIDELYNNFNTALYGVYNSDKFTQLGIINVKDSAFKASGSIQTTTGSITTGTATLNVASPIDFAVGQGISVAGAGAAGAALITKISLISGTSLTLATNASATVTNVTVKHDDSVALQTAINLGGNIFIPSGNYNITSPLNVNAYVNIRGVVNNTYIQNKGTGHGLIINAKCLIEGLIVKGTFTSGSGLFLNSALDVRDCIFDTSGRYGIEFGSSNHIISAHFDNCNIFTNVLGGVYSAVGITSQKNLISFNECYLGGNGKNSDGTTPTVANAATGQGFYIAGGIGWTISETVVETSSGSGIYVKATASYGIFGLTIQGCHMESNMYANIYVDVTIGNMQDINIFGNYYVSNSTPTGSLILTRGARTIVDAPWRLFSSSIDQTYDYNTPKVNDMMNRQSLKLGGELGVVNPSVPWILGITSNEPLANGYTCIRIDSVVGNQAELSEYTTFVDPRFSYRMVIDFRYKKTTSSSATISFTQLDINKATFGQPAITQSLASGDVWATWEILINSTQMHASTRYLQMTLNVNGTGSVNDYLLVRKIFLHRLDGVVCRSGTTAQRTSVPVKGEIYLDMSLNGGLGMGIQYNGSNWINPSTGATV